MLYRWLHNAEKPFRIFKTGLCAALVVNIGNVYGLCSMNGAYGKTRCWMGPVIPYSAVSAYDTKYTIHFVCNEHRLCAWINLINHNSLGVNAISPKNYLSFCF